MVSEEEKDKIMQKLREEPSLIDEKESISSKENETIPSQFYDPKLINHVHAEIDKDHLKDDKEKILVFLTGVSSLHNTKQQTDRMSATIKGDSADGKDNIINKAAIKHIPKSKKFTNATNSALEDDITNYNLIAISELNLFREEGANKHLIEKLKQLQEGGSSSLKKDITTGYKTAKESNQEQKSILKGTTEAGHDEELSTRELVITIRGDEEKNRIINNNTYSQKADLNKLLSKSSEETSWIKQGLTELYKKDRIVFIPYAKDLEKFGDTYLIDNKLGRSKRDIKKILSLTSAMTLLYQEQRDIIVDEEGQEIIISHPADFINTVAICKDFFNQTIKGYDSRLEKILDFFEEKGQKYCKEKGITEVTTDSGSGYYKQTDILEFSGYSKVTFLKYKDILVEKDLIEGTVESNRALWKKCLKGVQKVSILCSMCLIIDKFKDYDYKVKLNTLNGNYTLFERQLNPYLMVSIDENGSEVYRYSKTYCKIEENNKKKEKDRVFKEKLNTSTKKESISFNKELLINFLEQQEGEIKEEFIHSELRDIYEDYNVYECIGFIEQLSKEGDIAPVRPAVWRLNK